MTKPVRLIAALTLLSLPATAMAQAGGDAAYCQALASQYQRYVVGNSGSGKVATPDISAQVAVGKCNSDPTGSIPILEKSLRTNQIDLPKRQ